MKSTPTGDSAATESQDRPSAVVPEAVSPCPIPGIYVHVPFCFHKCHYCDFYSLPGQTVQQMDLYVDSVLAEADLWATSPTGPLVRPRTMFIGGGTPTMLPLPAMAKLLGGLRNRFNLCELDELTVEANPATVTAEYCQGLARCGVTRLSFGAQSFNRAELAVLERHHKPPDVAGSIEIARSAGFKRLNIDLIYAIPSQDLRSFRYSLDSVIDLAPEHVSAYNLTYESNTPLAIKKREGTITPVPEEIELEMFHCARRRLAEAGYGAYEISNYALPNGQCRHNLLYWNGGSYIGLGPSAASHLQGLRFRNEPNLAAWMQSIEKGAIPAIDIERLSPRQRAGELVMLQLRLSSGIGFSRFLTQTGLDPRRLWPELLPRLQQLNLIDLDDAGFRLSDRGLNVADAIAAEFLNPQGPDS